MDEFTTGASLFGFSLNVAPFSFPRLQGEDVFALIFEIELAPDDYDQVNGWPLQFAAGSADPTHPLSIFAGYEAILELPAPEENLPVTGDFNEDRRVTGEDIDLICSRVARGNDDKEFDVNGDGIINGDDVADVAFLAGELVGDLDFNHRVEFADFLTLSANFGNDGNYSSGDLDCSGEVDFVDFLALSSNFGVSSVPASVPEPTGITWMVGTVCLGIYLGRKRR